MLGCDHFPSTSGWQTTAAYRPPRVVGNGVDNDFRSPHFGRKADDDVGVNPGGYLRAEMRIKVQRKIEQNQPDLIVDMLPVCSKGGKMKEVVVALLVKGNGMPVTGDLFDQYSFVPAFAGETTRATIEGRSRSMARKILHPDAVIYRHLAVGQTGPLNWSRSQWL